MRNDVLVIRMTASECSCDNYVNKDEKDKKNSAQCSGSPKNFT